MNEPGKKRHDWNLTPREAIALQRELAGQVAFAPLPKRVRFVAGGDISYDRGSDALYAAVVVVTLPELAVYETATAVGRAAFPYISGLLSFREAPLMLDAFAGLRVKPEVIICDGQGIAHPRCCGLASHLGLLLGLPTIGCAKKRLCGEHEPVGPSKGDWSELRHAGRVVGCVLRTRNNVKPLYVSPGHLVDFAGARALVLRCVGKYRIPEPTRLAHQLVNEIRRGAKKS